MATTSLVTAANILKEVYEPGGINDQLQSEVTALTRVERTSEGVSSDVGGKYVRFPIRTQRNHGIGARNESEALPTASSQSYQSAQVSLKYLYGSLQLTGQTFELADSNYQAFASSLDQEVSGLKEGLRKDLSRQVYGTGKGVMATATSAGTTTTFITTNPQYLEAGMIVDLYSSADALKTAGATVVSISGTTVTLTTVSATASGDYLTRAGAVNREITGFGAILSTTATIYNINPASVPVWVPTSNYNGGTLRSLTEALMIQQVDAIRKAGGGSPTVILTSLGVRRSYFALLQSQRRIVNNSNFEGGFSGLAFTVDSADIPLVSDVDCPPSQMKFLNEKQLKIYQAADWAFMNRDGSTWNRVVSASGTFDAYQATMFKYMELGTHRRNAHADLGDITES